jgi:hypothetical protein
MNERIEGPRINEGHIGKITITKRAKGLAQVVKCLPSK